MPAVVDGSRSTEPLFGTGFADGKLTIGDSAMLGRILWTLCDTASPPLTNTTLKTGYGPTLSMVTSIVLRYMPAKAELRLIAMLASQTATGRLFPDARHLYMQYAAQDRLVSDVIDLYKSGMYKKYIRAFATIAEIDTLCLDYPIRALHTVELRHAMTELRSIWTALKTNHIHMAQDDLPWTMPGIKHVVMYHNSSWPFNRTEETMISKDYEPTFVMLEADTSRGPHDSDYVATKRKEQEVTQHEAEVLSKKEGRQSANATEANCFEVWAHALAEVAVKSLSSHEEYPKTTWRISSPLPLPGKRREMLVAATGSVLAKIFAGLRIKGDLVSGVNIQDDAALDDVIGGVVRGTRHRGTVACDACGWSSASE